jgi:hypothetical protein
MTCRECGHNIFFHFVNGVPLGRPQTQTACDKTDCPCMEFIQLVRFRNRYVQPADR